jgi:uncharacterized metal-binding protein YceD (DUF177 family)
MPFTSDSRPNPRLPGAKPKSLHFSRLLAVEAVPDTGLHMTICANGAERAMLATQCGVASVHSFEADFHVRRQGRGRFNVTGKLQARVTQICVVSLEPFESEISADIDVEFAPSGNWPHEPSALQGDPPDPIVDGQIDLGALAAEFLLLNLDLYPRRPGAVFEEADAGGKADERQSPFAVLLRR